VIARVHYAVDPTGWQFDVRPGDGLALEVPSAPVTGVVRASAITVSPIGPNGAIGLTYSLPLFGLENGNRSDACCTERRHTGRRKGCQNECRRGAQEADWIGGRDTPNSRPAINLVPAADPIRPMRIPAAASVIPWRTTIRTISY
jgi:hypothetical protein